MKYNSYKKALALPVLAAALFMGGCAKIDDFGNLNENPNGITQPITSALLTNVESQIAGFAASTRKITYAQYVSESQYTDVSLYSLPQVEMGGNYSGVLNDLQVIINYNSDPKTAGAASAYGSNANQVAIAKILKGYIFWVMTDSWGDIPYSESLLGASNLTPKFDKQEDIYFGVMADLKAAVNGFDNDNSMTGDVIYPNVSGNAATGVPQWKKLANSLRMLMAMRLTKKYPAAGSKAALEFADAYNNGLGYKNAGFITSNTDNFKVKYVGNGFKNPWYATYEARDDYAESKTMVDVLNGLGDTRQSAFGTNAVGFPYGLTRDLAVQFAASVNNAHARVLATSYRAETSPIVIVNAASVLLAKAEAIERGWVPGTTADAQAAYEAGITASFGEWGISVPAGYLTGNADYNAGQGVGSNVGGNAAPYDNFRAADNNVQDAKTTTKLQRIALQRWIAGYPNGHEGWCEWRRTGVPNLKKTRFATGEVVRRYVYGVNDYSLLSSQVKAAVANLPGGDKQESKIWWDQ